MSFGKLDSFSSFAALAINKVVCALMKLLQRYFGTVKSHTIMAKSVRMGITFMSAILGINLIM
ncbi:hypothetical protein CAF53_26795 [Sphingobium sp. LB126]|nr:hypothetical protein CAF53_26795 [Sphingobium sp. LB126]